LGPPHEVARYHWVGFAYADISAKSPHPGYSAPTSSTCTAHEVDSTYQAALQAKAAVAAHVGAAIMAPSVNQPWLNRVVDKIDIFGGGVRTPRTPRDSSRDVKDLLVSRTPHSPRGSAGTPRRANHHDSDLSLIVLPATYNDYQSWEKQFDVAGHSVAPNVHAHDEPLSAGVFHTNTQLKDGRPSLLVDPGSKGNLGGEVTIRHHARAAQAAGQAYSSTKRNVPLNVMGVGNGSQSCPFDCTTALGLQRTDGTRVAATYTAPVVPGSDLPALLGLDALMAQRALLDLTTLQLHFIGPGNLQLDLPSGSESFQLEIAPSGHLVLPCGAYPDSKPVLDATPLTLLTAPKAPLAPPLSSM